MGGGRPGTEVRKLVHLSCSRHQRIPNFKANAFGFLPHFVIPETQHLNSLLSQKFVSHFITHELVGKAVSATIEFHCQAGCNAEKVEVVNAARILATKFELLKVAIAE